MSDALLLSIDRLCGGYQEIVVVHEFTAELNQGSTAIVTGRNGVGKSTLLKLIMGSMAPKSGNVRFRGKDVTRIPMHRRVRIGMGYAPQEGMVFDELTVQENLTLQQSGRVLQRYQGLFDRFPILRNRLQQKAGTLSGGEKKLLSFCRVLAEDTDFVAMDEPTEGVQPENIALMSAAIRALTQNYGKTFLIVEQNLNFIEELADCAFLIDNGRCVYESGRSETLRQAIAARFQI